MPRQQTNDDYDSFRIMLQAMSNFKEEYHSFTTNKTYTDLLGKTASGLLKDVAKDTMELSYEDREQHKYSKEVFAAFCMHFCAKEIMEKFKSRKAKNLAGDVVYTVYERILKRIKRDLEKKGECSFVRNLIMCSADNVMKDLLKKGDRYLQLADESDKDFEEVPYRVRVTLVDKAFEAMRNNEKLTAVEQALSQVYKCNILSKDELFSICSFFGLGDGFKKLSNHEIAQILKCSDSVASKRRTEAIRKLRDFINNSRKYKEIFF